MRVKIPGHIWHSYCDHSHNIIKRKSRKTEQWKSFTNSNIFDKYREQWNGVRVPTVHTRFNMIYGMTNYNNECRQHSWFHKEEISIGPVQKQPFMFADIGTQLFANDWI